MFRQLSLRIHQLQRLDLTEEEKHWEKYGENELKVYRSRFTQCTFLL